MAGTLHLNYFCDTNCLYELQFNCCDSSFFCSGGGYGGGRFAPAGYGGATSVGYRGGAYGNGMAATGAPAGYGYPNPQGLNQGYYGGAGLAAVQGGYSAYGGAGGAPSPYGERQLLFAVFLV